MILHIIQIAARIAVPLGKTADGLLCLDAGSAILPADPGIYVHITIGMMSTKFARRKRICHIRHLADVIFHRRPKRKDDAHHTTS